MSLKSITPAQAKALMDEGAVLVDIREAAERARAHIPGSRSLPLSAVQTSGSVGQDADRVVFHCKSGMRTSAYAKRLAACTSCEAYIVEGGLDAWAAAGLPVAVDRSQPIGGMRQPQIVAGLLIALGVVLGAYVAPVFYGLSAIVGAGLIFAGVSGVARNG